MGVQGEDYILPWGRVLVVEHAHHPTLSVGLDLFVAHVAMQLAFVKALDAGFANRLGAAVLRAVERLGFFLVDASHIAH
ncbi:hypothetical protein D3C80_1968580 [compost metagenome]